MSPFVRRPAVRHTDRVLGRSVLFLVLAAYTATFVGIPKSEEAEVVFQTVRALTRSGSFALTDTPEALDLSTIDAEATTIRVPELRHVGSAAIAVGGVGCPALVVPFYFAGRALALLQPELEQRHAAGLLYGKARSDYFEHVVTSWSSALLGALTAWLVVLVARRLGATRPRAFVAGLTYAFTTFAWPQACSNLPDITATFTLFFAFHLILQVRERFERLERPRPVELLGIGFALGATITTRPSLVLACLVLTFVTELRLRRGERRLVGAHWISDTQRGVGTPLGLFLVFFPIVLCLLALLGANFVRFGHILDLGHGPAVLGAGATDGFSVRRFAGVFLAPGRGILWLAPLLLVTPWGVQNAFARGERHGVWTVVAVSFATWLTPEVLGSAWHGSWSYGPRHLLPALPFLWVLVALALRAPVSRPLRRVIFGALAICGFTIQIPAIFVDPVTHQDLAEQAASLVWPAEEGISPAEMEALRFERIQWDWGFAAPWAHWRLLRHRVAGLDESYSLREIFRVDDDTVVVPRHGDKLGFTHLTWVDYVTRLDGSVWPPALLVVALALAGLVCALRGLDPSAP